MFLLLLLSSGHQQEQEFSQGRIRASPRGTEHQSSSEGAGV